MNSPERILCAAIRYNNLGTSGGVMLCGYRHAHIINQLNQLTGLRSVQSEVGEYEQGFLTSRGRFVNREEGYTIAKEQNQIVNPQYGEKFLFSEHLY